MTFFWNKSPHPLQPCLFLDHRALVDDFFIIFCFNTIIDIIWARHCTTSPRDGSLCSPMLHHITRVSGLFFPEFVWQFWLLFFDFSKRLDGWCHDLDLPACSAWSPVCPASLSCRGTPSPSELHTPFPPETPVRAGNIWWIWNINTWCH